jgi:hypothetical protein
MARGVLEEERGDSEVLYVDTPTSATFFRPGTNWGCNNVAAEGHWESCVVATTPC